MMMTITKKYNSTEETMSTLPTTTHVTLMSILVFVGLTLTAVAIYMILLGTNKPSTTTITVDPSTNITTIVSIDSLNHVTTTVTTDTINNTTMTVVENLITNTITTTVADPITNVTTTVVADPVTNTTTTTVADPITNTTTTTTVPTVVLPSCAIMIPAGTIAAFGGPNPPVGWLLCDGSSVSIAQFGNLYVAIKAVHGSENNYSFKLPNLRNRFIMGAASSVNLADKGGAKEVALNLQQIPNHNHKVTIGGQDDTYQSVPDQMIFGTDNAPRGEYINYNYKVSSTGSGQPHENRPPFYVLTYMIKT